MEQHDDHCWLRFKGLNWLIIAKRGHLVYVAGNDQQRILDLSQFRYDLYARDAYDRLMKVA